MPHFVSGGRQLCSLLYPVLQLHHVCSVDAKEDVQDFRQLRPLFNDRRTQLFIGTNIDGPMVFAAER